MTSNDKVILITGCSSGIGLDAALYFQQRGWRVLATCRAEADCVRLRDQEGLISFRLDYEDEVSISEGVKTALSHGDGRIDVLFNNGAYGIPALVEDLPTAALRQVFEANFFGWHELTRQILPHMHAYGSGRIIQNSSVLGFAAMRCRGAYNSTKFALEGLTDTLRLELKNTPISLSIIEPGPIRTRIRHNSYLQFLKWIAWQESPRRPFYEKTLIPRLAAEDGPFDLFELMPEAVTKSVWHAATSPSPRIRYRITQATKIMALAKRFLPDRMMDRLTARY